MGELVSQKHAEQQEKLERELGPELVALMRSPTVRDVMVNPLGRVFVDDVERGGMVEVSQVDWRDIKAALGTMAAMDDSVITPAQPLLETELDGFEGRVAGGVPPVVVAPFFAFRRKASRVFRLDEYVERGQLTKTAQAYLEDAIRSKKNLLISGGTGSGKTTFANALLACLAELFPACRLVIIEDTRELQCSVVNRVDFRQVKGVATMETLLHSALRCRPDRIVVGEVRGSEATVMLKAWNTGHPGGFATIHANDSLAALGRLETLVQDASTHELHRLPERIAEYVDCVVQLEGHAVTEILEVKRWDGEKYVVREVGQ